MKIVELPSTYNLIRRAYRFDSLLEQTQFTSFKKGDRVLPADYFNNETNIEFYFQERHEPGEKHWIEGGFECRDSTGGFRAFKLDALISHPSTIRQHLPVEYELSEENSVKKRGRKKTKLAVVEDKPKRSKGRPKKDPSERKTQPYVPKGTKRGRKPLSEEEKQKRLLEKENKPKRSKGRPKKSN